MVEDYQSVLSPALVGLQERLRFPKAAGVTASVYDDFKVRFTYPQTVYSRCEQAIKSCAIVLARHKNDEIEFVSAVHPRTPVAKRVPRSASLRQSRRLGCSVPDTMSVAPSAVRAKQSTWEGSASERTTGE